MAAKTAGTKRGGSMMSLRSGFRGLVGQKGKGKKKEADFFTVLGWVLVAALVGVLIWSLR